MSLNLATVPRGWGGRGTGTRRAGYAAAWAVVPQAPVMLQRPSNAEDSAFAEDLGS
jgi:hypothetical protein